MDRDNQLEFEKRIFRNILLRAVNYVALDKTSSFRFAVNSSWISPPDVIVDGIGQLQYPITHAQGQSFIAMARPLHHSELIDDVIKAWELIASNNIRIDQTWISIHMTDIINEACDELGVMFKEHVEAKFYKLLLYEEGCHFQQHQDTEREAGMFATLLIQLPSKYTGGDLVITHNGAVARISNAENSENTPYYTAFFSDCKHALEPVTSGYRVVLAFNLCLRVPGTVSESMPPISYQSVQASLQVAAHAWIQTIEQYPDVATKKLCYLLSGNYTQKDLSFVNLSESDLKISSELQCARNALGEPLFQVYLVLVCLYEKGIGVGKRSHAEMLRGGHVETDISVVKWVGEEGNVELPFEIIPYMEMLVETPPTTTDDKRKLFPDKPIRSEYVGGFESPLERWYQRAALIFWPYEIDFDMKLSSDVLTALQTLSHSNERNSVLFSNRLNAVLEKFEKQPTSLLGDIHGNLLRLVEDTPTASRVLKLYELIGLPSNNVAHEISFLCERIEWYEIADSITEILTGINSKHTSCGYALTLLGDLHKLHTIGTKTRESYEKLCHEYLLHILASGPSTMPTNNICVIAKLIILCPACHDLWKQCERTLLRPASWNTIVRVLGGCLSLKCTATASPESLAGRTTFLHDLADIALTAYNSLPRPSVGETISTILCVLPLDKECAIRTICERFRASSPTAEQYRQLLQNQQIKNAIHHNEGPLRELLRRRIAALQVTCTSPPQYDWAQPSAINPHPEIQAFLRSSDRFREIHGFASIKAARDVASKCCSSTLKVLASGRGHSSHLECRKLSTNNVVEIYESNKRELDTLIEMLATAEATEHSQQHESATQQLHR